MIVHCGCDKYHSLVSFFILQNIVCDPLFLTHINITYMGSANHNEMCELQIGDIFNVCAERLHVPFELIVICLRHLDLFVLS